MTYVPRDPTEHTMELLPQNFKRYAAMFMTAPEVTSAVEGHNFTVTCEAKNFADKEAINLLEKHIEQNFKDKDVFTLTRDGNKLSYNTSLGGIFRANFNVAEGVRAAHLDNFVKEIKSETALGFMDGLSHAFVTGTLITFANNAELKDGQEWQVMRASLKAEGSQQAKFADTIAGLFEAAYDQGIGDRTGAAVHALVGNVDVSGYKAELEGIRDRAAYTARELKKDNKGGQGIA